MIYADEPTGNLDRAGGDRIIQLLRDRRTSADRLHQTLHVAVDCFGLVDRSSFGSIDFGVVGPKHVAGGYRGRMSETPAAASGLEDHPSMT